MARCGWKLQRSALVKVTDLEIGFRHQLRGSNFVAHLRNFAAAFERIADAGQL
jgi:hypothetical protein